MVKWTKKVLRYAKIVNFLAKGLKAIAKCCLKVMLKSKGFSLVLDIDFVTLIILKLEFSFIFLEFIIYLSSIAYRSILEGIHDILVQ